jgi:hypothetical protein
MIDRSIPNTQSAQRVLTRRAQHLAAISLIPWICCAACVMYRPVVTRPPTLGDELISLDQAKKDGLITQEEFDKRRAETIAAWKAIGNAPIISVPPPSEPAAGEASK